MGKASQRKKLKPYYGQGKNKSSFQGKIPTHHQLKLWLTDPELIDWLVQECSDFGCVENRSLILNMVNHLFAQFINDIDFDSTVKSSDSGKEIAIGIDALKWTIWIMCSEQNRPRATVSDWHKKVFQFPKV